PVGLGLGALFLAYDGFDYPLARRGLGFGAKWAYLARHPGLTIGYGIGTTLLYLVPLAFVVAPPCAAAGAPLGGLDDDTRRGKREPGPGPESTVPKKPNEIAEKTG